MGQIIFLSDSDVEDLKLQFRNVQISMNGATNMSSTAVETMADRQTLGKIRILY